MIVSICLFANNQPDIISIDFYGNIKIDRIFRASKKPIINLIHKKRQKEIQIDNNFRFHLKQKNKTEDTRFQKEVSGRQTVPRTRSNDVFIN